MPDVIDGNKCIGNGLPASVMRQSIENKNLLDTKGSIYVGTGNNASISIGNDSYAVYRTIKLSPNGSDDDGKIIRYNSSTQTGMEIINPATTDDFVANRATNVDLCSSVEQLGDKVQININAGTGQNSPMNILLANGSACGVVKLVDGLGCNATDTVVSANAIYSLIHSNNVYVNSANFATNVDLCSSVEQLDDGYNVSVWAGDGQKTSFIISGGGDSGIIETNNALRNFSVGYDIHLPSSSWDKNTFSIGTNIDTRGSYCLSIGNNIVSGSTRHHCIIIGEGIDNNISGYSSSILIGSRIGYSSSNNGQNNVLIGDSVKGGGTSVAIGQFADCGLRGVSIGLLSKSGMYGVSIGESSECQHSGVSIGESAISNQSYTVAIGGGSRVYGERSIALGVLSNCSGCFSAAIGYEATMSTNNAIQLGGSSNQYVYYYGALTQSSDSRVKEDITEANTALCLENINKLKLSRYKYKNFVNRRYDIHQLGWLADDVETVFPKSVSYTDREYFDRDENYDIIYIKQIGENGSEELVPKKVTIKQEKNISFHHDAVPVLWGAVQELSKKIDALERENQELKERINSL